jgi:3-hydroxybutyrate dehydrogenase
VDGRRAPRPRRADEERYVDETLTKSINTVDEAVAMAMLLALDAGAGVTGTAINVDGGTSPY